jgi:23S rRNA (adenine2503-C2)-methyltransferase
MSGNLPILKPLLLDSEPAKWGLPKNEPWREKQIREWIFRRFASSIGEMSNLPAGLRAELAGRFRLAAVEPVKIQGSADTTRKILWRLGDGSLLESVLIPANPGNDGGRSGRLTLCVSSQVGCAYGCRFCASGLDGWRRNLTAAEIVGQVLGAAKIAGRRPDNLVFMGMGEPLANLPRLRTAMEIFTLPEGLGIGARHLTVSTSGLAPQIEELAQVPGQFRLALSLHAGTNETRNKILPVNRKYPLEQLIPACETFARTKRKMITFEYILLKDLNDDPAEARAVVRHARRLHAKVNLIPYNTVEGLPYERPSEPAIRRFQKVFKESGVEATIRREKGHDIDAACGQLRLREEKAGLPA